MKRIIAILALTAMMLSLFAGCKAPANNQTPVDLSKGVYDGSEVTITFEHTMGAGLQEVLNYYIEEFNEMYPNITITHKSMGGWGDINGLVNTEISGGNAPNIVYCYPDHVAMYNRAKAVVSLDDFINSTATVTRADGSTEIFGLTQEQKDDFIPEFFAEGQVYGDGKTYTMPLSKSTEILYYNKTFFETNNLEVPTTWEEMKALCQQIKAIDPSCTPMTYDSADNWFITLCEQYGVGYTSATGDHYLFDNDTAKGFVKELRDWYQTGLITTKTLFGDAYTSKMFIELDKSKPHSYMCIGSSGGTSYQDPKGAFEVGMAPIPQVDPANPKAISQGPSLCILQGNGITEQEIMASWLFVKFLTTNVQFQGEFSMTSGYMPVIKSVQNDEIYKEWLSKADGGSYMVALSVRIGLENVDTAFTSDAFVGSTVAREQVGAVLEKCISDKTDNVDALIDQAFKAAIDECEFRAPSK